MCIYIYVYIYICMNAYNNDDNNKYTYINK